MPKIRERKWNNKIKKNSGGRSSGICYYMDGRYRKLFLQKWHQDEERTEGRVEERTAANAVSMPVHVMRSVTNFTVQMAAGLKKTTVAATGNLATILGSIVLIAALGIVVLIAGIAASPFGILFSNEPSKNAVPLNVAIAQINIEISDRLAELQNGSYDDIDLNDHLPDWREVAAVFACKTAGADSGVDVASLTPDRVELLREVFWDMCTITTEVERTYHPADDATEAWTEKNLDITVEAKTADDMRIEYGFSDYQSQSLTELLARTDVLDVLLTDLNTSQEEVKELLQNLPKDLSPERRVVVETACSLVGKVNYFWGGKSLTQGWNSTWGQLRKVTADGSPTTDTYHPYGLDCSGFVDWVFYNVSGGEYILGHGGGARMQHRYCTDIDWEDAQPGDLVFYPEDTHVGIVSGVNADGVLYVIHCASRSNGVIISSCDSFASAARSLYFVE